MQMKQFRSQIFASFIHSTASTPSFPCRRFPVIFKSVRCFSPTNGRSSAIGDVAASHPGLAKVVLKKGKTHLFRDGNPMVYSGAVDKVVGRPAPKTGDIVVVADGSEKPIAWGIYNSVSMFCVRLMQTEHDANRDPLCILNMEELLQSRINDALELRRLLKLPESDTNAYRLVNSEGDRHVMENGINYSVSLEGQKTGFYADQRDSRLLVSSLSKGRTVLDVFCYSGGFALNAAFGGAVHVTGIDSSLPALELAEENVKLNNFDSNRISFLKEDATDFMKASLSNDKSWDLVILDPPKLAPSRKVLQRASSMYCNINGLAMRLTKRGGLLMTCSCSGAMTQSGLFLSILQKAASSVGRKITVLRQAGAAADHPLDPSYPEGSYLTNYLLRIL